MAWHPRAADDYDLHVRHRGHQVGASPLGLFVAGRADQRSSRGFGLPLWLLWNCILSTTVRFFQAQETAYWVETANSIRRGDGCNPSGGDDLVAALAQNGDGLRADQAGAADNDDLHIGLISFSPSGRSRPRRCDNATGPVASAQDFRKASSSAFTSTWWVAVMPCG